ncbi:uncharacterized protein LOC141687201 isoform X2 [Apium graveolens]|uniref:uncharacterized protein LOC141687201 isoform X2 n=1 Tax=Apium graveolens TaxID=4045 RepID=UPI003D7A02DC
MAALLRRKNKLYLNLNFCALGHAHSTELRAFTTFTFYRENYNNNVANWGLGLFRHSCYKNTNIQFTTTASQFLRFASTNTQPRGEDFAANNIVDQPCSSSTKASWQESYDVASKVLRKIWSTISGIGPLLRAMANMTSHDWVLAFEEWKDDFHHYRGIYLERYELMFYAAKISMRLLVKIFLGKRLSHRERLLLTQSTADLFSLVPGFMYNFVRSIEFMLPVFLNPFPIMISKQGALKRKVNSLNARSEFAFFLQDTARALIKLNVKQTVWDHDDFQSQFRRFMPISNENILFLARLLSDELILDIISIAQLVNICNCMGIPPCGTDEYLRLMLRKRLKTIKKEDKEINEKGVESLSEADLHKCCRERGIHLVEEMRQQLYSWLDLSLNHQIPPSLLILSITFATTEKSKPEEAILATMFSFPHELALVATARSLSCPDAAYDKSRRQFILRMQKKLIKDENIRKKVMSDMKQSVTTQDDPALEEMTIPLAYAATEQVEAISGDKQKKLCEISYANAAFSTALPVITECEKFLMLVKNEINLIDIEGEYDKKIAMKADRAAREVNEQDAVLCTDEEVSSGLAKWADVMLQNLDKEIDDVDAVLCTDEEVSSVLAKRADVMLQNLDKEIDDVDAEIGYRWRGLDRYCDGTVSPEMVAAAALYLKDAMGKEGIQKLISNISDHNGE